jgi:hypothetical protein
MVLNTPSSPAAPQYAPTLNITVIQPQSQSPRSAFEVMFDIPLGVGSGPLWDYFKQRYPGVPTFQLQGVAHPNLQAHSQRIYQLLNSYFGAATTSTNPLFDRDLNTQPQNKRLSSQHEGKELLRKLAPYGHHMFRELFVDLKPPASPNLSLQEFRAAKKLLMDLIDNHGLVLAFAEMPFTGHLFPWTFLFRRSLPPSCTWDDACAACLAFFHQIEDRQDWANRNACLGFLPTTHAAVCPTADFHSIHSSPSHPFRVTNPAHCSVDWLSDVQTLRRCLQSLTGDAFYFFGHADSRDPAVPLDNWLELQAQQMTVDDLQADNSPNYTKENVFVFVNGCEVASMSLTLITPSTIVGRLGRLEPLPPPLMRPSAGPVHCLTTIHKIPSTFAAIFGSHFWQEFLPGNSTAGEALLAARIHMAKQYGNPLGLLYTYFGNSHLNCRYFSTHLLPS